MPTKFFAAFLILTIAVVANGFQSTTEWVKYASVEGRYNVLLPQQPKLSTQEGTASTGENLTQYLIEASDSDSLYMLAYFDYGTNMNFSLDKARDGAIENVKGTLLSEKAISLGAYSGLELKTAARNRDVEVLLRARIYDIGGRVYILQHIFMKSSDSPAIAEKTAGFFDSFKVTAAK